MTQPTMEPHKILGVEQGATETEIRAAYKKLAMKWHPDRPCNNSRREEATEMFAEINKAHRTLLRRAKRAKSKQGEEQASDDHVKPESTAAEPASPSPTSSEPIDPTPCPSTSPVPTLTSSSSSSSAAACQSSDSEGSDSTSESLPSASSSRTSFSDHSSTSCPSTSTSSTFPDTGSIPCPSPSSQSTESLSESPIPSSTSGKPRRTKLRKQSTSTADKDLESAAQDTCHPKSSPNDINDRSSYFPDRVDGTLYPERPILRGRGADVAKSWTHVLTMTLEELYHGKTFHFRVVRCRLSGKKSILPLEVEVPAGSREGSEVIIPDAGNERKDGSRQDIVFLIKEAKNDRFRRVHDNLVMEVRLPWTSKLNEEEGVVHFRGVDGREMYFVVDYCKSGILSGSIVIPDAGMPLRSDNGNGGRGKLLVRWEISSPRSTWGETIKQVLKVKSDKSL